jgi:cell cycle sensor histidine kinase DivJ
MAAALPVISADPDGHAGLMGVGLISAALYGTCLALGVASLAHTGFRMLRAEEDRYRLLAEATSDVVTCHGVDGTVRFASPAAEQLFGIPAKKLLGHGLVDRVHVADRPALLHALTDAAATCGAREAEFRALRPDADGVGTDVWIELRCRPLERSARASFTLPSATVAVMRDITERKAQQQALESARGEAEWANAGKSRFLATVSHELRTPLNAIIGFSDMLLHDSPTPLDPARRRDYAQLIKDSGAHLLAVVNSILDMAKLETGNFAIAPEALAPAPSIAQCCELMELSARGGGVALVTRVPAELPAVRADRRAVHQILINLISNAIKFTPRGGAVTVSANAEAQWVALTVTDTGVGIAEADLPRVGDPFFQSGASYDRRHDGTGLGVSIVKGLVDLHGGRLDIASRLGHGTSVTVRLPRHGARAAAGAGETPAVRKAVRSASLPSQQMRVKKRA